MSNYGTKILREFLASVKTMNEEEYNCLYDGVKEEEDTSVVVDFTNINEQQIHGYEAFKDGEISYPNWLSIVPNFSNLHKITFKIDWRNNWQDYQNKSKTSFEIVESSTPQFSHAA